MKKPRAQRVRRNDKQHQLVNLSEQIRALLTEIRDDLRASNSRLRDPGASVQETPSEGDHPSQITPELGLALALLAQSSEELAQAVKQARQISAELVQTVTAIADYRPR
jgi:hypothetical protein